MAACIALIAVWPGRADGLSFSRFTKSFDPGTAPNSIAAGYLNGDNLIDLAGTSGGQNEVITVIFTPTQEATFNSYPVGSGPSGAAIGDLNGDGKQDLAVANGVDSNVSILDGDGTGGFTDHPGGPVSVGFAPNGIAIAQLDHAGRPEIVTADAGDNGLTILKRSGGIYSVFASPPLGDSPVALSVADLNNDGMPDIATANNTSVSVLLGDGTGNFSSAPGSPFPEGGGPSSLAVGDLDGDGKPDIAVANSATNDVTVLHGKGDGRFVETAYSPLAAGGSNPYVASGDMNGDGNNDLVIASQGTNTVSILLGNGKGRFEPADGSPYPNGVPPTGLLVVDVTHDGVPDVLTVSSSTDKATALLNRGWPGDAVSPTAMSFPDQQVRTIGGRMYTRVTNNGKVPLHIDRVRTTGVASDDFLVSSDSCTGEEIAVGQSCRVGVRFAPVTTGGRNARLEIRSDAPHSPATVTLSGRGLRPPR